MRTLIASAAAIIVGLCLIAIFVGQGSAVPVQSGMLPLSLQRLMENPVIQVKSSTCYKQGLCKFCYGKCDDYKHSDYCKDHHQDPKCCDDWEEKCNCVGCDHAVPQ